MAIRPEAASQRACGWLRMSAPSSSSLGRLCRSISKLEDGFVKARLAQAQRRGAFARPLTKDVQSAQLVPGFGERMQSRLKGGSKRAIGSVTVESVDAKCFCESC